MAREVVVAPAPIIEHAWMLDAGDVVHLLGADLEHGLTTAEAGPASGRRPGRTCSRKRVHRPAWLVFLEQFTNAMIVVLLVAALVTALIGDIKDTLRDPRHRDPQRRSFGFVQEHRAERAMAALKEMTSASARVGAGRRDPWTCRARRSCPGTSSCSRPATSSAADARLIDVGRAAHQRGGPDRRVGAGRQGRAMPCPRSRTPSWADQRNMAFKGTAVTSGRGRGVVVATGHGHRARPRRRPAPGAQRRTDPAPAPAVQPWQGPGHGGHSWSVPSCSWPASPGRVGRADVPDRP